MARLTRRKRRKISADKKHLRGEIFFSQHEEGALFKARLLSDLKEYISKYPFDDCTPEYRELLKKHSS